MRIIYRPLIQPPDLHRGSRASSPFRASWGATMDDLRTEARAVNWRSTEVVIKVAVSDYDINNNGEMSARFREPTHPGVEVIVLGPRGESLRFECDRYTKWRDNVRAIVLTMKALRAVERYGTGRGGEAYVGFRELPSGIALGPAMDETMARKTLLDAAGYGLGAVIAADTEWPDVFRQARKRTHPDQGGTNEQFNLVQRAGEVLGLTKGQQS